MTEQILVKLLILLVCLSSEYRRRGMSSDWMSAPWNRLGGSRLSECRSLTGTRGTHAISK